MDPPPVVLVHGWKSHPGIWNRLAPRLAESAIPVWNFDHVHLDNQPLEQSSHGLWQCIRQMRREYSYDGSIDIVCHSMGTCIARFLFEVLDGETRCEKVRHLIGIGPPNNGSAMAELFNHPRHGPEVIRKLTGIFVPEGYVPGEDVIVQEFRPGSRTMKRLAGAGPRPDISYHIILATNPDENPDLFPPFSGQTPELMPDGSWRLTWSGDGIVTHSDSLMPCAEVVMLPMDPGNFRAHPDHYSHIKLPRNEEVVGEVLRLLKTLPAQGQTGVFNRY